MTHRSMSKLMAAVLIAGLTLAGTGGMNAQILAVEAGEKPEAQIRPCVLPEDLLEAVALRRGKTVLSKLAAKMQPGTWVTFSSAKRPKELMYVKNSHRTRFHIAGWTDDGHWNSRTGQFLYYGFRQAHKFIAYSEEKNEWRVIPKQYKWPGKTAMGHIYGGNAFNSAKGIFYNYATGSNRVYAYDLARDKWSDLPALPFGRGDQGSSLVYFPELGGLVHHRSAGKGGVLHLYREKTKSWSVLGRSQVCGYHSMARYNPCLKEMLIAGGDRSRNVVEKIDSQGKITRMKDAPVEMTIQRDHLVVDPVSGRYLMFNNMFRILHDFDSRTNKYKKAEGYSRTKFGRYEMPVPASIPEYGVIMLVDDKIRLYKHKTD